MAPIRCKHIISGNRRFDFLLLSHLEDTLESLEEGSSKSPEFRQTEGSKVVDNNAQRKQERDLTMEYSIYVCLYFQNKWSSRFEEKKKKKKLKFLRM